MVELVTVGLVTALLVYYLLSLSTSKSPTKTTIERKTVHELVKDKTSIPGWNRKPADPVMGDLREVISTGSLHHYLMKQHKGGRIPLLHFGGTMNVL